MTIIAAGDGRSQVPSIRAEVTGAVARVRVSSDGDGELITNDGGGGVDAALPARPTSERREQWARTSNGSGTP